jgi:hypothetical protein
MYFTDESLLPEHQQPLMITVAPYGPQWMPSDYPEDIPVTRFTRFRIPEALVGRQRVTQKLPKV